MTGVVSGGWEFVWAAYGITAAVLLIYGVTLVTRIREEVSRSLRDRQTQ
jgi:heme exporter protein D